MAWALWLAAPIAAPVLVGIWLWLRGRPRRLPTTREAMRAHQAYLDALVSPARSRDRLPR